ncbi:MAG: hypothetical protein BGO51_21330 [Rhodospirillales bacterium 69-11]|nr:C39 family peptidase [Rhodospirillales bacterium]OJW27441.1 MAG: hypothetical protein BGO51_21330 [Rhodospirillales bacterium 69-11]
MQVPYFSQWESPDLTSAVIAEGEAALRRDPRWRDSGATDLDEYATWALHCCGMACLKMVLAARTGRVVPILDLARGCTQAGGYVVDPAADTIRGLIYAPFVPWVAEAFGLDAGVVTDVTAADLPDLLRDNAFFIASVHHAIRWPEQDPPHRGGHLVLVYAADAHGITFHNPSGHTRATQQAAHLPLATFERFFAGRGIRIARQPPDRAAVRA